MNHTQSDVIFVETEVSSDGRSLPKLTVVVIDDSGSPIEGAKVSVAPIDVEAITNSAGEAIFTLGTATQYQVTATAASTTVTVPYYVTEGGATRLVVNPEYVKTVEDNLATHGWLVKYPDWAVKGGGILAAFLVLWVLWKLLFKRRR